MRGSPAEHGKAGDVPGLEGSFSLEDFAGTGNDLPKRALAAGR